MGLKRNLQIVWDETTFRADVNSGGLVQPTRRYVGRAFSSGGPGWGVYDCKKNRFLKDREVAALSIEALRQPLALN